MTTTITNPLPGLHTVHYEVYRQWQAVNASSLKHALRSWAHFRHELDAPPVETDALRLGRAFHMALLEPDRAASLIVCPPKFDRRTKDGKATAEAFEATLTPDHIQVDAIEREDMGRMRAQIMDNPEARLLLTNARGVNEQSVLWCDKATGIECKGRIDRLLETRSARIVIDIKTAADASPKRFAADAIKYGYDVQAAHYADAIRTLHADSKPVDFVWIVVEKAAPFAVMVYRASEPDCQPDMMTFGQSRRGKLLRELRACRENNKWPGYGEGILPLRVPAWEASKMEVGDE
jgi:hypothetical protein